MVATSEKKSILNFRYAVSHQDNICVKNQAYERFYQKHKFDKGKRLF